MTSFIRAALSVAVLGALAGCASSPTPVYLTLDAPHVALPESAARAVVVGPVTVPETLDRAQVMLTVAPGRLMPSANLRWAQPYRHELARALAAHLAQISGNPRVVPASAALPVDAPLRLSVDVLDVELREGDSVLMEVLWTLRESGGKTLASQRSVVREPVTGRGSEALVAAQGRAVKQLANEIAPSLR